MSPFPESLSKPRPFRVFLGRSFMVVSRKIWASTPDSLHQTHFFRNYGRLIHRHVRKRADINPNLFTCFMRNRPQYELLCDLAAKGNFPSPLRLAVVGCSRGAEVFSLKLLLAQRAEIQAEIIGIDISEGVLKICREGRFPKNGNVVDGLSPAETEELLEDDGEDWLVKKDLRSGIEWLNFDIRDPEFRDKVGTQDILVANNVLIHMPDDQAAECLRNLVSAVAGGGYICFSGIKLEIRSSVARELKLEPVTRETRNIHNAFPRRLQDWPWNYYGLEPYDPRHPDHDYRYTTIFRVPDRAEEA